MNRFVNAIDLLARIHIRHIRQTRTRQQPQAPGNHARLVADDIPKQITRHHDPIQRPRILHHRHRRAVNQLVLHLQLRELPRHDVRHHLAPQPTRRQHVRLVQTDDPRRRALGEREMPRHARDALNLHARVRLRVPRLAVLLRRLLALAKVYAAGELAQYGEVDALDDRLFERRGGDEGFRGEEARPQVAERRHFLAELEDALFRADGAAVAPFLYPIDERLDSSVLGGEFREGKRTGPPIAPRKTASAVFAAWRASSVNGEPVASIDACPSDISLLDSLRDDWLNLRLRGGGPVGRNSHLGGTLRLS